MQRLTRVLATAAVASVVAGLGGGSPASAQTPKMQGQTVRLMRGSITGTVSDDRGGPLAGALVSALGATLVSTVSDSRGYFSLDALPLGEYVLQAHLTGFGGSPREVVRVGSTIPAVYRLHLRRLEAVVGTTGVSAPVTARPIMAAGFELPASITLADQPDDEKSTSDGSADHPHTETAWRLRHVKRSILKDASATVDLGDDQPDPSNTTNGTVLSRAVDSAATLAATLFNDLPFSGEVNVLTTGSVAPGNFLSGALFPRGVAYLSIGAPTSVGAWSARAAMSEGDLSSWIVAGSFASRPGSAHAYNLGLSYSTQEYVGGNPAALAAVTDGSRNVGELYAFDRWNVLPRLTVEYGGRYAHYDYLQVRGLLSPRLGVTIEPVKDTRITTTVGQRMIAPGAEEFLATGVPGPWLPPERTFAPLGRPDDRDFRVERARYVEVGLEHQFEDTYVLGVRRFFQDVDDQLVTLFGVDLPGRSESVGHYYVADAGAVAADGWAFRLSSPPGKRMRASIDYSVTQARWLSRADVSDLAERSPATIRPDVEDLHDVTTSFEADIPETSTHVFLLYKVNTGFSRTDTVLQRPGFDARFDVQVNQALPFAFAGTRWEILVGLRNLFHDPSELGSVYDELLVVRPPKRVVGGFLVRF
jgi:hypothetical protein